MEVRKSRSSEAMKSGSSEAMKSGSPEVRKSSQMHKHLILRFHYSNDRTSELLDFWTSKELLNFNCNDWTSELPNFWTSKELLNFRTSPILIHVTDNHLILTFLFIHNLKIGSLMYIRSPSLSMNSLEISEFFTPCTLADVCKWYFLMTSLFVKPVSTPSARATMKLSCSSVRDSTSR